MHVATTNTSNPSEIEWCISTEQVPYEEAVAAMETRVENIIAGKEPEMVWLLEHPPLYTAGTSAKSQDLIDPKRFPIYETGRGGQYTYHGPGQRIAYVMLNLKKRYKEPDLKRYVYDLEEWIIRTLAHFNIKGERQEGRVGIWVEDPKNKQPIAPPLWGSRRDEDEVRNQVVGGTSQPHASTSDAYASSSLLLPHQGGVKESVKQCSEAKIAAIGIRVRKWVTYHGIAVNVHPDLSHYAGIIPCGVHEHGITSLKELGSNISLTEFDKVLKSQCFEVFDE